MRGGPRRGRGCLPLPSLTSARRAAGGSIPALHLFGGVLATAAGRACTALLRDGDGRDYLRLFALLADEGWSGDAWRAHMATAVVRDGNGFTLAAEPGPGLRAAAELDLRALQLFADGEAVRVALQRLASQGHVLAPLSDLGPRRPEGLARQLAAAEDWAVLADDLRGHARGGGAGPFAAALAYRWEPGAGRRGRLRAIAHPDLPGAGELCGYEQERALVAANTERLLAGLPAQDVLLYGERGTGKSSTVKALLAQYSESGLRLIELGRRQLPMLPRIWDAVEGAPQRFIVFVDDLSFEEDETEYKDAKAALQGGLRARPANALVYATSNRRHLVRERLTERGPAGAGDDPRQGDAVEEKLSLADRFGLTVVFAAPDQALFLRIVDHLARRRGLDLPPEDLRAAALRFTLWQGGRSGRSARQFVDGLTAAPGGAAR